jgi:hypothetical protein
MQHDNREMLVKNTRPGIIHEVNVDIHPVLRVPKQAGWQDQPAVEVMLIQYQHKEGEPAKQSNVAFVLTLQEAETFSAMVQHAMQVALETAVIERVGERI